MGIILFISNIFVGGSFRTEMTFDSPNVLPFVKFDQFEETFTSQHWLFGLVQGGQPDLQALSGKYSRAGM
jgi:hypothetical protein